MPVDQIKQNGVHYTPNTLAEFLSKVIIRSANLQKTPLSILDPACGDGSLLGAIAACLPKNILTNAFFSGFDTDGDAISRATNCLSEFSNNLNFKKLDFLEFVADSFDTKEKHLFSETKNNLPLYDIVIANPPYVRTQVLGAEKAQTLADIFNLEGRVDLYQAFVKAMSLALREGGTLGVLTSNRFLSTQAGASLRQFLLEHFDLQNIYDLGDTKLFSAAVLPVILVGTKKKDVKKQSCTFTRIYEAKKNGNNELPFYGSVLDAVLDGISGLIKNDTGVFEITNGHLAETSDSSEPWTLHTPDIIEWLNTVKKHAQYTFDDVAKIRVGIKTTADSVFVRDDWDSLPGNLSPEKELLRPLITHHITPQWKLKQSETNSTKVLYTHEIVAGQRQVINIESYPKAKNYLESHYERLSKREYVIAAGRKWYEIWVPQNPAEWPQPKIVFPDISEMPRFAFDNSGAIVNGDCYWITLRPGFSEELLYLMLAIANSTFIVEFYDRMFHNKLYAGRRRFITQYVKKFPLPGSDSDLARKIIAEVKRIINAPDDNIAKVAGNIDSLVWQLFGLRKEVTW